MMDKKMIEQWAREAGIYGNRLAADPAQQFIADAIDAALLASIERFAVLVAAHEREQCADLVQANANACDPVSMLQVYLASNAAAIRARGEVSQNG